MSKDRGFVHLHAHTDYSTLDGAARISDVVEKAIEEGQGAVAITDHGTMAGVAEFVKATSKAGVTGIVGCEFYQAYDDVVQDTADIRAAKVRRSELRKAAKKAAEAKASECGGVTIDEPSAQASAMNEDFGGSGLVFPDKPDRPDKERFHILALAENNEGYVNLSKMSSRSFLDPSAFYRKPRVDLNMIEDHRKGVIFTSGCLGGIVPQQLIAGHFDDALETAAIMRDICGPDNYLLEVQDHGIPEQSAIVPGLREIAKRLNLRLVITNDFHYVNSCDHEMHDRMLAIQTSRPFDDPNRFRFPSTGHHMASAAEMRSLFGGEYWVQEACDNTLWVADRVRSAGGVELPFGAPSRIPKFPKLPSGVESTDYLWDLTFRKAEEIYGRTLSDEVTDRLEYELNVIERMGFADYFLITADIVDEAKRRGIFVGPGRGSAAGCHVAYCLGITAIDAIEHKLLFERFLNESRVSMPDIDLDFESSRRAEMFVYCQELYGEDFVCQVGTVNRLHAKSAIRDVARSLGLPPKRADAMAKVFPDDVAGRSQSLVDVMDEANEGPAAAKFRSFVDADDNFKLVVQYASELIGRPKSDAQHAAAVILANEPLQNVLPLRRVELQIPSADHPGEFVDIVAPVSQYEQGWVEELGYLKMDFLGLSTLDVDRAALLATGDPEISHETIPMDDPAVFDLIATGETVGLFQIESDGMRRLCAALQPRDIGELSAVLALYRPGPMDIGAHEDYVARKFGRSKWEHIHPDAADILGDTYGLPVFQEQIMLLAQRFAGYSLVEADNLRKAMGKKLLEKMVAEKEKFIDGVVVNGYEHDLAVELWDTIEPWADYGFNRSHAVAYAFTTYYQAWLRTHYPAEFFAASIRLRDKKASVLIPAAQRAGVNVRPPSLLSKFETDAADGEIRIGLSTVHGVGTSVARRIESDTLRYGGQPRSLRDLLVHWPSLTKAVFVKMVSFGSFRGVLEDGRVGARDLVDFDSGGLPWPMERQLRVNHLFDLRSKARTRRTNKSIEVHVRAPRIGMSPSDPRIKKVQRSGGLASSGASSSEIHEFLKKLDGDVGVSAEQYAAFHAPLTEAEELACFEMAFDQLLGDDPLATLGISVLGSAGKQELTDLQVALNERANFGSPVSIDVLGLAVPRLTPLRADCYDPSEIEEIDDLDEKVSFIGVLTHHSVRTVKKEGSSLFGRKMANIELTSPFTGSVMHATIFPEALDRSGGEQAIRDALDRGVIVDGRVSFSSFSMRLELVVDFLELA